jgi:hypothetical protein
VDSTVPIIASTFLRVANLSVHLTHLLSNTSIPLSSESMMICLLRQFKEHRLLISLCVDGQFIEGLKII